MHFVLYSFIAVLCCVGQAGAMIPRHFLASSNPTAAAKITRFSSGMSAGTRDLSATSSDSADIKNREKIEAEIARIDAAIKILNGEIAECGPIGFPYEYLHLQTAGRTTRIGSRRSSSAASALARYLTITREQKEELTKKRLELVRLLKAME